jgi:hypothetical protein
MNGMRRIRKRLTQALMINGIPKPKPNRSRKYHTPAGMPEKALDKLDVPMYGDI